MVKKYKPICDEGAENLILGILNQTRKDIVKGRSHKAQATRFLQSEIGQWLLDAASGIRHGGREVI